MAWWIGDQPIYKSEVEEMYQTMLYERANIDGDPYCVIPEQLAIEKLFLHQAELDTVEVSEGAVSQRVEMQINYLINELGTQEKVEQFYRRPLPQIRETMMESMRNRYIRCRRCRPISPRTSRPHPPMSANISRDFLRTVFLSCPCRWRCRFSL